MLRGITTCPGRLWGHAKRAAAALRQGLMHLLMGRRFMRTLERNRTAADHLDSALKELLER